MYARNKSNHQKEIKTAYTTDTGTYIDREPGILFPYHNNIHNNNTPLHMVVFEGAMLRSLQHSP